jgi:assimilatory nitrate reductase catalytic subunit
VGALVSPVVDPVSGEPEFKHTPVRVEPFLVDWYGFVLTRRALGTPNVSWWTMIRGDQFLRYEMAGRRMPADSSAWMRELLAVTDSKADFLDYSDVAAGIYRAAHIVDDRLDACIYVSLRPNQLPARNWLGSLFTQQSLEESERAALLAGRPPGARVDPGRLVCSCFGVGRNTILRAIEERGLTDARQVGACLRAGTNCGSCLPEINALLGAVPNRIPVSTSTALPLTT